MASIPARILECSICFQRLSDPRSLPCDHIFCNHCITDWLRRKGGCPYCRKPATLSQLKPPLYILSDILNSIQTNDNGKCAGCEDCVDILNKCQHCDKNLCTVCERQHLEEVKNDIRKLCDELISIHGPELDKQEENILTLMSEATGAKEKLITQLRNAHESLNDQISELHAKSLETLKKMEDISHPDLNAQVVEAEAIIERIRTCTSESVKIFETKNLNALINLEGKINRLQRDISDFQEKQKALTASQVDSPLKNLRINPMYKWLANVIEEAEMLR